MTAEQRIKELDATQPGWLERIRRYDRPSDERYHGRFFRLLDGHLAPVAVEERWKLYNYIVGLPVKR